MKKTILFIMLAFIGLSNANAQVGIGTTTPNASAILELEANDKGFLPPRMTNAERDAISNPAEGLMIYNLDTKCQQFKDNYGWYDVCDGAVYPFLESIDCAGATNTGKIMQGGNYYYGAAESELAYTGGNGNSHTGQVVNSTGVTGLTATLAPGTLNNGAGTLTYSISGTAVGFGTASFAINIGQQTCTLEREVLPFTPAVTSGNGVVWMDRNLGASQVAASSTDAAAYGDLYQWGRAQEGHESRSSSVTTIVATTAVPNTGGAWDGKFIDDNDWLASPDPNLWQGVNGTNNPCPTGFRLPSEAEWLTESSSWSPAGNVGAYNSPLKLPAAGRRRNDGSITKEGAEGHYWSSTTFSPPKSFYLEVRDGVHETRDDDRASGRSVRCLLDDQ